MNPLEFIPPSVSRSILSTGRRGMQNHVGILGKIANVAINPLLRSPRVPSLTVR
ncbi:BTB/POZ and TAZ domain-containing protein 1 [Clarias magur]|uniref:BTB/POZ and TAZ domain-containing protein 1 n=1 Tax=Clarias magur TaxID=1594786 RepID=A0A8J4TV97_CLAMG|nr:BTB/POZ and TAZ domain-containing protein 1 [Clarias magur]